jgi:hypothetical protein
MQGRDLAFGAIAGTCATMAMTVTKRALWERLPPGERYPLPPREIVEATAPDAPDKGATALVAHFVYGALTGAAYAVLPRGWLPGALYGPMVWTASYFGWIPAARILTPAHRHPARRNALMILAHVVWGVALSRGLDELQWASGRGFHGGPARDRR